MSKSSGRSSSQILKYLTCDKIDYLLLSVGYAFFRPFLFFYLFCLHAGLFACFFSYLLKCLVQLLNVQS